MPPIDTLNEYLLRIGATDVLRARAVSLLSLYEAFPAVEPVDFFVSEYENEDGSQVYESLYLFNDQMAMEAKIPGPGDERFDFVPIAHGIRHVVVQAKDYDLKLASSASRMLVQFWLDGQRLGELKATGANCDSLTAVTAAYLIPNVASPGAG
jgi:hypothetical protein